MIFSNQNITLCDCGDVHGCATSPVSVISREKDAERRDDIWQQLAKSSRSVNHKDNELDIIIVTSIENQHSALPHSRGTALISSIVIVHKVVEMLMEAL
jgi:hypothetical protein